jgi:hypothetical protein
MNSLTLLTCLMLTLGTVPPVPDTLIIVDRGSTAWPLFRKEPKRNREFYHLDIIVTRESK